jgi:AraC family transcriptional regulator
MRTCRDRKKDQADEIAGGLNSEGQIHRDVRKRIHKALAYATRHLDEDVSLEALAKEAGLSAFHLQRLFSAEAGETPKQFTLRLRLERAAAMLLTSRGSVLDIALGCGFQSHEAFSRAFRRQFQTAPSAYRARGFAGGIDGSEAGEHAGIVGKIGPCIKLFHTQRTGAGGEEFMEYAITKKEIPQQPVIVVRRRTQPGDVAKTLGEALGHVFQHAQQKGIALAGQPFTRYIEWGPGLWTIEAGMPVTARVAEIREDTDVRPDALPGGWVATTTHAGPYDKLNEAHAAMQRWIEAEGLTPAGAPWEVYTTDPADYPDPRDWKTEVFWPVKAPGKQRAEIASKPVVYQAPGMDAVTVEQDIPYDPSNPALTMDLYRPPGSDPGRPLPAVIFVFGYSDLGAEKMLGCKLKEMEVYIGWAKLVAASGMIGITYSNHDPMRDLDALFRHLKENAGALGIDTNRIGVWAGSGNVPRALGLLMKGDPPVKCAALCYGVMLDLDGATGAAEGARRFGFANPTVGKRVEDLPPGVPLFVARAGCDTPEMNQGIDRFVSRALARNLPITVANHPEGLHGFDVMQDSETSREIIRRILDFLRHFTQA